MRKINPYKTVCIGGEQDGRVIAADSPHVRMPVNQKITDGELLPLEPPLLQVEDYRLEEFAFPDEGPHAPVLILAGISVRDAFDRLLSAYSGDHVPTFSALAHEERIVRLQNRISELQAEVRTLRAAESYWLGGWRR